MAKSKTKARSGPPALIPRSNRILAEVRSMIESARERVAGAANAELTMLYWRIGGRIRKEILADGRAAYGEEIVATLSRQLEVEYGGGFAEKSLRRMVQFAEAFPSAEIVATLSRQLSWSHFVSIIPLKEQFQREYYAEMCRIERWSVRTLRERIDSMLYERTALSKKPAKLIERELAMLRETERMSPELVMRDPYLLAFLGLADTYLEADLEAAVIREMESFLLELGAGFSFVARQKRIQIDGDDFYLDLLFYNRKLRRLVAIELKVGEFKAEYKGQMELYLRWLDKHEREADEESPLGIIFCTGRKREQIELLELNKSGIHVAEYLTALPPRAVLSRKLLLAEQKARRQLEQRGITSEPQKPAPRGSRSTKSRKRKSAPKKRRRRS